MSEEDITFIGRRIGYSDSIAEAFGITRLDRRRHLYVQGKTGSGKSTLLTSMIVQDIHRGEGVCLIDPLGHTAEAVLSYVPRWRTEQMRYLNVADLERPVGLNILAGHHGSFRHRATAAVVDVFSSIWDLSLSRTPQLLDVLGYAVAALTEVPGATLLLLPRFLTDKGYRERIIETRLTDPAVRAYWRDDFGTRARREQREMCGSVLNKVGELRRDPVMRNIFGQEHNKLDIPAIIANREILIVNLAKGEIGRENARLIPILLTPDESMLAAQPGI
jgi:energy-coupling factor transporter ATP-binding protein EcfA2